jgi:hypothetical protein
MHDGGAMNVMMPTVAGLALLAGLALGDALLRPGALARGVPWLLTIQVAMLGLDWGDADTRHAPEPLAPARFVPSQADRAAAERLVSMLRKNEGDVMVPRHGYFPRLAGKHPGAHEMAVIDLKRSGEPELAARLLGEMFERSAAPGVLIVVDEHVDAAAWPGFARGEPLVAPNDVAFLPVIGLPTRPVVPLRRAP